MVFTVAKSDNQKPEFLCTICPFRSTSKQGLTLHGRIHIESPEKPLAINLANKPEQIQNLLGLLPHKCNLCNRSFATVPSLRIHATKTHKLTNDPAATLQQPSHVDSNLTGDDETETPGDDDDDDDESWSPTRHKKAKVCAKDPMQTTQLIKVESSPYLPSTSFRTRRGNDFLEKCINILFKRSVPQSSAHLTTVQTFAKIVQQRTMSRTILIYENFGSSDDVLVFALFAEEDWQSSRVAITRFGSPSFIRHLSVDHVKLHSELFAAALLGYLAFGRRYGNFQQVFISRQLVQGVEKIVPCVFNCPDPYLFTKPWLDGVISEANKHEVLSGEGSFEMLGGRFLSVNYRRDVNGGVTRVPLSLGAAIGPSFVHSPNSFAKWCFAHGLNFETPFGALYASAMISKQISEHCS